jgi:hypothetical protein
MGDPVFLSDSEGEYLELINVSNNALAAESVLVVVNGRDSLWLNNLTFASKEILLICRDSLTMTDQETSCSLEWPNLSVSNASEIVIELQYEGSARTFNLERPQSGISWENTLDSQDSYRTFVPAVQPWLGNDLGSPGFLFSGSKLPLNRDLAVVALDADTSVATSPKLNIELKNTGLQRITSTSLTVKLDMDWDGTPERILDSLDIPVSASGDNTMTYTWAIPQGETGVFIVQIGTDENLSNNQASILYHPGPSLVLTEVCPNPPEEFPEWLELKNASSHSISLKQVRYNQSSLDPATSPSLMLLRSHEFAILTESIEKFRQTHADLKLKLLEMDSWDVLRNTGDTITLTLAGSQVLEEMRYASLPTGDKGKCLVRDQYHAGRWYTVKTETDDVPTEPSEETSSPGYEFKQDSVFSWSVSAKTIDISRAEEHFVITIASPVSIQYTVKVFDLSGYEVAALCEKCSGKKSLQWYGKNKKGQTLPVGPYILWTRPGKSSPRKKVVILAKPL